MEIRVCLFLVLLLTCTAVYLVAAAAASALNVECPVFVAEGGSLDCTCETTSLDPACRPQWTHGESERGPHSLLVPHVKRQDNGTRFTCQMICDGQTNKTQYILQVAYGPSEGSVQVQGPPSFLVDGKTNMTLTCSAGDVNPQPQYRWKSKRRLKCENLVDNMGKTCTFTPTGSDDEDEITCTAVNVETFTIASAVFTLNLTHPPQQKPQLSGYSSNQQVNPGDSIDIRCTVTGGKPLVSKVCLSADNCSSCAMDEVPLEKDDRSVTSTLRINVSEIQDVQCICCAVWEPKPELYQHIAQDTIRVSTPPDTGKDGDFQNPKKHDDRGEGLAHLGIILGVTVPEAVVLTAFIAFVVWRKRKRDNEKIGPCKKEGSDEELLRPVRKAKEENQTPQVPSDGSSDDSSSGDSSGWGCISAESLRGELSAVSDDSDSSNSEYHLAQELREKCAVSVDDLTFVDESGSYFSVKDVRVAIQGKDGASKGRALPLKISPQDTSSSYTEVDLPESKPTATDVSPYDAVVITGSEVPKPQTRSPDTTPCISPYNVVTIAEPELPAPKPCFSTSHLVSFGVNPSITRKPGPLGDHYTQVDKKKSCVPMTHEEKGVLLGRVSAEDGTYDKVNRDGKIPKPHESDEQSPYCHITSPGSPPCRGGLACVSQ